MEPNVITQEFFAGRLVAPTDLEEVCREVRKKNASKVGERICKEITTIIKKNGAQTVSWSLVHIDILTPVIFDKVTFHELGIEVKIDHKDVLYSELKLYRKISWEHLSRKHPDIFNTWKPITEQGDELWLYEQPHGPPEWAVSEGVALVRSGEIFKSWETDFSF